MQNIPSSCSKWAALHSPLSQLARASWSLALASAIASCGRPAQEPELPPAAGPAQPRPAPGASERPQAQGRTYVAVLTPVNDDVTPDTPLGQVSLVEQGDQLRITVQAEGLPPNMTHLQHIHGFTDSTRPAACPTRDSDTNRDGFVDLDETQPVSGVTLIPLHDDPASLEILADSYPAGESVTYSHSVPLSSLRSAIQQRHGIEPRWDARVVYLHGVPPTTALPASVKSLPGVPAHMTLPIACGEFQRIK